MLVISGALLIRNNEPSAQVAEGIDEPPFTECSYVPPFATVVPTKVTALDTALLKVPLIVKSEEVDVLSDTTKVLPEFTKVLPAATEQVPVAVVCAIENKTVLVRPVLSMV